MKRQRETPLPSIVDELGDDTDEIELSPEQIHALSLASDADDLESSTAEVSVITATDSLPPEQSSFDESASSDRWPRLRVAGFLGIAAAVITVGGLWRSTATRNPPVALVAVNARHHDVPVATASRATSAAIATPTAPAPASPTSPTIRIRNAFDRSEVFEFPAGTSEADARRSVADMLLQRARERR